MTSVLDSKKRWLGTVEELSEKNERLRKEMKFICSIAKLSRPPSIVYSSPQLIEVYA